jgi:hypothetical protein
MDKVIQRHTTIFGDGSKSYDPDVYRLYCKWEVFSAPQNTMPGVFA